MSFGDLERKADNLPSIKASKDRLELLLKITRLENDASACVTPLPRRGRGLLVGAAPFLHMLHLRVLTSS